MTLLSVVVPTISGREESLARTLSSYEQTLDGTRYEIIQVKDAPSWPAACNKGYLLSEGDAVHFTADDLEALPGWQLPALLHLSVHNELPAPRVYDYRPDGHWNNWRDGADGAITPFTRIPIMTRAQADAIGPWPEIDYYADVWVSERARALGIETRMVYGYDFVHHWSGIGRVDSPERLQRSWADLEELRKELV